MITLISLNSSIDQVYEAPSIQPLMRVNVPYRGPGGKTLNVAKVLQCFDIPIHVIAFRAGHTGRLLTHYMLNRSIETTWIDVDGESRFCTTILSESGQFEMLERGHFATERHIELLIEAIDAHKHETKYFIMSGSLPNNMTNDQYDRILQTLKATKKPFILDISGQQLQQAFQAKPLVMKPNETEFMTLCALENKTVKSYIQGLQQLQNGPHYLCVSLGANGALLKYENTIYFASAVKINAINAVGSGDSFVAGFVAALYHEQQATEALRQAMAAGMANATQVAIAELTKEDVLTYLPMIQIERIGV